MTGHALSAGELETWVRSVAQRCQGCERWEANFSQSVFVGCDAHRSADPLEWCIGCEAQALVERMHRVGDATPPIGTGEPR